jgi:hypothetical protein
LPHSPADELQRLSHHLEPVKMSLGDALCDQGAMKYAYYF